MSRTREAAWQRQVLLEDEAACSCCVASVPCACTTSHLLHRRSHIAAALPRQQPVSDSRKDATQESTTATSYSRSRPSSRQALPLPERTKASVCCSRGFLPVVVNRRSA